MNIFTRIKNYFTSKETAVDNDVKADVKAVEGIPVALISDAENTIKGVTLADVSKVAAEVAPVVAIATEVATVL